MSRSRNKSPAKGRMPIRESVRILLYTLRYYSEHPIDDEYEPRQLSPPELSIKQVNYLETALRCRFPYEILACFANQDSYLLDWEFHLGHVINLTHWLREIRGPKDWIAVACEPGGSDFYCFERQFDRTDAVSLLVYYGAPDEWESHDLVS